MAKKTITKEHPLTTFRKANEARDVVVKSSMKKMQTGGTKVRRSADDYKDEAMYAKKRKDLIDKNPNALYTKAYSTYSDKIDSLAKEGTKKQIKAGFVPKVLQEAQKDIREKRKAYKK